MLLFGSAGYIGTHLKSIYPDAVCPRVDIADAEAVAAVLDEVQPGVVVNAAGKTGRPNVDWCEDHKEETWRSNVEGPIVLLEECKKRGIYWVHVGSGCIYEGDNGGAGFSEEDAPNFTGSYYAQSKAEIDQRLKDASVLTLRLRMPFDGTLSPRNLIQKLKGYPKVLDVQNSLTCMDDFLQAMRVLIEQHATGIYNVVNPGTLSPYQIMEMYREIVDPAHTFERLTLADLPDVVKAGRSNCVLSTAKLEAAGVAMRPVEEAVRASLLTLKAVEVAV